MFSFNLKPRFTRKYAKLVKPDRGLEERIAIALDRLAENPRFPELKSHKVTAWDRKLAFSSEVTGDLRVIWRYHQTEVEVIDLIDTVVTRVAKRFIGEGDPAWHCCDVSLTRSSPPT